VPFTGEVICKMSGTAVITLENEKGTYAKTIKVDVAEKPLKIKNGEGEVEIILTAHETMELLKENNKKENGTKTHFGEMAEKERTEKEEHFEENHKRIEGRRYIVGLPKLKKSPGDTYGTALKRQLTLEKKMKRDKEFTQNYHILLRHYENEGYMSKVSTGPGKERRDGIMWYTREQEKTEN
jgi:hypothetical protein